MEPFRLYNDLTKEINGAQQQRSCSDDSGAPVGGDCVLSSAFSVNYPLIVAHTDKSDHDCVPQKSFFVFNQKTGQLYYAIFCSHRGPTS